MRNRVRMFMQAVSVSEWKAMQMKKILVAIDIERSGGNDFSIKAAQDIAGVMGGTLVFLYVVEPMPSYVISQVPEALIGEQKSQAEEELGKLAAQYGCSDIVVREGTPATEIIEHASEINADLIVVDSHDPDLSNYFIGSTASRVVRHAHCSVHVVRHPDDQD